MTNNPIPEHILKGLRYLDIINLEKKFIVKKDKLFNRAIDYFIDLSQVQFAELNAVTQLLLRIETLLKEDCNIYVALPTISEVEKEAASTNLTEDLKVNIRNSRIKANSFLKTIGFVSALQKIAEIHNKEAFVSEKYNFESKFNIESFENAFSEIFESYDVEYSSYKYVFPLEWINCKKGFLSFSAIEKRFDKILSNAKRGLDPIDIQGIKNVVVSELIKNVYEHSGSEYALFTIGLIDTISLLKESDLKLQNEIEQDYITWIGENKIPSQVEIYFGDSGLGILKNEYIEKYKCNSNGEPYSDKSRLKLAFQKWTTLKNNELRRGTKGLYRIQRIVNKYNGIFHITTSKHNGGYRKGGLIEEEWCYRKVDNPFNGTFIQIKLCPFSNIKQFKYVLKENNKQKRWKTIQYTLSDDKKFLVDFKKDIQENKNLLLILNLQQVELSKAQKLLEKVLPEISYDSHPNAIVIYILSQLHNDTIQTIVDSVNTVIINNVGNEIFQETTHQDAEDVYDPVLVIGEKDQAFWYGGNQDLITLLNEAFYKDNGIAKLSDLQGFNKLDKDTQTRIRLHLENDNKLVNVDSKEIFHFNFTNINKFFENEILNNIEQSKTKEKQLICTPKLEVVNSWLDVNSLLANNAFGYALTLFLKYKSIYFDSISTLDKNNLFILIDHKQQKTFARAFASLIGVNHKNIKNTFEDINVNIPKRTKLFPENSKVIVLTTIISSSETIRRLVKYVKRDSAIPEIVLCLCNYRKYDISQLQTWNEETNIISIYTKYNTEHPKSEKDLNYFETKKNLINTCNVKINPDYKTKQQDANYKIDSELKDFLKDNKILHYNHVGIYKDRHFTFYLDKIKLLNTKSFIYESIKNSILKWKQLNDIKDFTLYIPSSLFPINYQTSELFNFISTLTKNINVFEELPNIINDKNIVFFDFGMITGKSINTIITKCHHVSKLFFCVLFNQSVNSQFEFYKRIETLNNENSPFSQESTGFSIEYLYKLPLGYFNSESCPICEHIRALDYYKLHIDYLYKFSEDRQQRIKLIDSEEIHKALYPFDFYYTEESLHHELSSDLILKMYELKNLLEDALINTESRISLYNYIFEAYKNIDLELKESDSDVYAITYYLSHEINWLQREPLVFRDFRHILALISHKIAILDRDILSSYLGSNRAKTTSDKLAVRYKYSAISLLRSTQKLLFCESISDIITSAKYSNNILQNTLYHITSLYKNKYNKSTAYFKSIDSSLNSLSIEGFSLEQKLALQKIELLNKKRAKEINNNNFTSEFKVIQNFKNEISSTYSQHHPKPIEFFHKLYLTRYESIFSEYNEIKENARNFATLKEVQQKLPKYWNSTLEYINNSVLFYLEKLDGITTSQFYRNNYSNIINLIEFTELVDRFSELVYLIEEDLNNYILYKKEYNLLYDRINNLFIKSKGHKGGSNDCKILSLLSNFPTNIKESIDIIFPESTFVKRNLITDLNIDVYYPRNEFLINLDLVRNNIERKKNEGIALEDISINFDVNILKKGFLELIISYDSTDLYKKEESKSGSLSNWKHEISFFEGSLEYILPNKNSELFILKLKLLNYE